MAWFGEIYEIYKKEQASKEARKSENRLLEQREREIALERERIEQEEKRMQIKQASWYGQLMTGNWLTAVKVVGGIGGTLAGVFFLFKLAKRMGGK